MNYATLRDGELAVDAEVVGLGYASRKDRRENFAPAAISAAVFGVVDVILNGLLMIGTVVAAAGAGAGNIGGPKPNPNRDLHEMLYVAGVGLPLTVILLDVILITLAVPVGCGWRRCIMAMRIVAVLRFLFAVLACSWSVVGAMQMRGVPANLNAIVLPSLMLCVCVGFAGPLLLHSLLRRSLPRRVGD